MRIDAHQHYWRIDRGDYDWITPDNQVLNRDYFPGDLERELQRHGIERTIVVQAAATLEETSFLLRLADETPSIAGVVGWVDVLGQQCQEQLEGFLQHPKFVGCRVMIQDMVYPEAILGPEVLEVFRQFERQKVPVDLLCTAPQLPVVLQLLNHVPNLHAVVDHLAKPDIRGQVIEPWKSQIAVIAECLDVYCKVSGMVTEADVNHWKQPDFQPYVDGILDLFGPERVMFGSDWPVCLLAASYDDVVRVAESTLLKSLTKDEMDQVFGRTAETFYRLSL